MDPVRFAIVGCGRIFKKHAESISDHLADAVLVGVCDLVPERARLCGEKYNVPYFSDADSMFKTIGDKIDVVCILTPSGDHAERTIQLAKYKKHIVVEKPMALTLDDADRMIHSCRKAGVKLFVVKQNRYNLPVKKLREAIDQRRFGKLVMGTVRVRWCRDQSYYDQDEWRGTWKSDGGVFTNQASHHIDLLEWMMGDVESVYAKSATRLVDIEVEDTGAAIIKFKNGSMGIVEATTATRPKDLEGSISVMGEFGTVEVGGFAVNEMKIWNFSKPDPKDSDVIESYKNNPPDVYGFGHVEYLKDVISSVQNNTKPIVGGEEGRKSLELISAIYESIETGREVALRYQPANYVSAETGEEVLLRLQPQNCRLGL